MSRLRLRFGVPRGRHTVPEPGPFRAGSAGRASTAGGTGRVIACLVAVSLVLGACSGTGDATGGSEAEGAIDGPDGGSTASGSVGGSAADGSGGTGAGTLSFGDPADVGFEAVEDVEQDPVPLPSAAGESLSGPDEIIPGVTEQLARPADGDEILDTVDVVDDGTEVATERDGRSRNSTGELAVLDDAANLACAHVEIALSQLDDGQDSIAIERIWQAADRAGHSDIAAVREWQEPLSAVIAGGEVADLAPLIGFITVCAEGGYEL